MIAVTLAAELLMNAIGACLRWKSMVNKDFSSRLLTAGVEPVLCQILVIYAALPVASLLPVYSVKYDPNPENHLDAADASILSVLLSALSIPVWYMLIS